MCKAEFATWTGPKMSGSFSHAWKATLVALGLERSPPRR